MRHLIVCGAIVALTACGGGAGADDPVTAGGGGTGTPGAIGSSGTADTGGAPPTGGTAPSGPVALADCGRSGFADDAVRRINALRAAGASCGSRGVFAAAGAVVWNAALDGAAAAHSHDMATRGYVSHTSPEGDGPGVRIAAQGYDARTWAENIAAGQPDTPAVLAAWMGSDGHCANLMNPGMRDIALACVSAPGTRYTTYWTLKLGAAR